VRGDAGYVGAIWEFVEELVKSERLTASREVLRELAWFSVSVQIFTVL
jgi:hypothetical protein